MIEPYSYRSHYSLYSMSVFCCFFLFCFFVCREIKKSLEQHLRYSSWDFLCSNAGELRAFNPPTATTITTTYGLDGVSDGIFFQECQQIDALIKKEKGEKMGTNEILGEEVKKTTNKKQKNN